LPKWTLINLIQLFASNPSISHLLVLVKNSKMPLNIDLNTPCVDSEMMESYIEPSINLNYPSSSTFNFSSIDLNEEKEICKNEIDLLMEDINIDDEEDINIDYEDINIDDLYANEALPMEEGMPC
jgi:hypothetical protein